jgi:hypothetical protein
MSASGMPSAYGIPSTSTSMALYAFCKCSAYNKCIVGRSYLSAHLYISSPKLINVRSPLKTVELI